MTVRTSGRWPREDWTVTGVLIEGVIPVDSAAVTERDGAAVGPNPAEPYPLVTCEDGFGAGAGVFVASSGFARTKSPCTDTPFDC